MASSACTVGKTFESFCSQSGKTVTGKTTPPSSQDADLKSQLIGSPRLTTTIKLAAIIPKLLAEPIVSNRISTANEKFPDESPPGNINAPHAMNIPTRTVVIKNFQRDDPKTIVEKSAGVEIIASKVPVDCASWSLALK